MNVLLSELGSDEEEGKDWSDLEREAAEEDNIKHHDDMGHKSSGSDPRRYEE